MTSACPSQYPSSLIPTRTYWNNFIRKDKEKAKSMALSFEESNVMHALLTSEQRPMNELVGEFSSKFGRPRFFAVCNSLVLLLEASNRFSPYVLVDSSFSLILLSPSENVWMFRVLGVWRWMVLQSWFGVMVFWNHRIGCIFISITSISTILHTTFTKPVIDKYTFTCRQKRNVILTWKFMIHRLHQGCPTSCLRSNYKIVVACSLLYKEKTELKLFAGFVIKNP